MPIDGGMVTSLDEELPHLRWAVKSRSENQQCGLKLLELFNKHPDVWKKTKYSLAAQSLVAIAFSLWRAAFLADKVNKLGESRKSATSFLTTVIRDNTINYVQDRTEKEWTFNYYMDNARLRLLALAEKWHALVPTWKQEKRSPTERWEYAQNLLFRAIANFEKHLDPKG